MDGPLNGITVVDLTRVLAGPFCTMVLRDLGARVIKVEQHETGDDSRAFGPFTNGQSAYFASLNRGKESIALNLKDDADRQVFRDLLHGADVLVENFRPGTMERLGFGWHDINTQFPNLIYAAASGFGHSGPYANRAAYDMIVQAMGGVMSITGTPGGPPVRVGSAIGDIAAGLFTAIGINAALLHRATTGRAIKVDVAMLDCQVALLENAIARYVASGDIAGPIGARHPTITPFAAFSAADTWFVLAAGNDSLFAKLLTAMERTDLEADARFRSNDLRTQNWEALFAELNATLAGKPAADWISILTDAGVPAGPINTIDQVVADPQVRARNMIVETNHPVAGQLAMAGNPIKLSGFADPATRPAAPLLDENREQILADFKRKTELQPIENTAVTVAPVATTSIASRPLRYLDQFSRLFSRRPELSVTLVNRNDSFVERAQKLADALISQRGEVLGTAIAVEFVELLSKANAEQRRQVFTLLAERYDPDPDAVQRAMDAWRADANQHTMSALIAAVEPPRQELFRRANMAPGGTQLLVNLRKDLLGVLRSAPELNGVNDDLKHLFNSWFNRGFLELRRIDWNTPASILEKLIAYEAVHSIDGWDDLQRRLSGDRRCFGFFHPALPNEPLIFIEIALVSEMSDRIEPILRAPMPTKVRGMELAASANTAVFYSISNCQPGLRSIAFGNFLIKQVATDLASELPNLKTFATLSPIPGLRRFVENPQTDLSAMIPEAVASELLAAADSDELPAAIDRLLDKARAERFDGSHAETLKSALLPLTARYLVGEGNPRGPGDPVARFHLGNGARVERVNWASDLSASGLKNSYGVMVNYLYDLTSIADNHEAFANRQPVARSKEVGDLISPSDSRLLSVARDFMPGIRSR